MTRLIYQALNHDATASASGTHQRGPFVELGFGVCMSLERLMVQLWMAAGTGASRNRETDVVDDPVRTTDHSFEQKAEHHGLRARFSLPAR